MYAGKDKKLFIDVDDQKRKKNKLRKERKENHPL